MKQRINDKSYKSGNGAFELCVPFIVLQNKVRDIKLISAGL
jgi:hypothetical protein